MKKLNLKILLIILKPLLSLFFILFIYELFKEWFPNISINKSFVLIFTALYFIIVVKNYVLILEKNKFIEITKSLLVIFLRFIAFLGILNAFLSGKFIDNNLIYKILYILSLYSITIISAIEIKYIDFKELKNIILKKIDK